MLVVYKVKSDDNISELRFSIRLLSHNLAVESKLTLISQCDAEVEIHELRKDMSSKLTSVQDELANKIREFEELRIEKESAEKSVENKNREIEHLEKENSSRQNDIERHELNLLRL